MVVVGSLIALRVDVALVVSGAVVAGRTAVDLVDSGALAVLVVEVVHTVVVTAGGWAVSLLIVVVDDVKIG